MIDSAVFGLIGVLIGSGIALLNDFIKYKLERQGHLKELAEIKNYEIMSSRLKSIEDFTVSINLSYRRLDTLFFYTSNSDEFINKFDVDYFSNQLIDAAVVKGEADSLNFPGLQESVDELLHKYRELLSEVTVQIREWSKSDNKKFEKTISNRYDPKYLANCLRLIDEARLQNNYIDFEIRKSNLIVHPKKISN